MELAGAIGGLVAAVISLRFIQEVWIVVIATVAVFTSRLITNHLVRQSPRRLGVHRRFVRPIDQVSLPAISAGISFWLIRVSDQILLPFGLMAKVTRSVVVPRRSKASADGGVWHRVFFRFGLRITVLSLLVVSAAGIAGHTTFRLTLVDVFLSGAAVLPIVATAFGL